MTDPSPAGEFGDLDSTWTESPMPRKQSRASRKVSFQFDGPDVSPIRGEAAVPARWPFKFLFRPITFMYSSL
jgi:hypothetical protein